MGKQAGHRKILLAFVLFMLMTHVYSQQVPIKLVDGAAEKRAVCIDGSPGGYNHAAGSGDGANSWLIHLMGGGWCWGQNSCYGKIGIFSGGTNPKSAAVLGGLLSANQATNPDFYNWNRVSVHYCDGASFFGDSAATDNGTLVQLRGSKIFTAIMEELLERGLKNANNAILAGGSAGGLAAILHCDAFHALLPNTARVKCLSDAGYFIRAKDLPYNDHPREWYFIETVKYHNIGNFLPTDCTSKMDPNLCLFPEYSVGSIKTPLFILNSAFDFFQIHGTWPNPQNWVDCFASITKCTPDEIQRIKDLGKTFRETLKVVGNNPQNGWFITSCNVHGTADSDVLWSNAGFGVDNKSIAQAFADWFFDRSPVKVIDTHEFIVDCKEQDSDIPIEQKTCKAKNV